MLLNLCMGLGKPHVQIKTDANIHDIIAIMLKSGKPKMEQEEGFIFP